MKNKILISVMIIAVVASLSGCGNKTVDTVAVTEEPGQVETAQTDDGQTDAATDSDEVSTNTETEEAGVELYESFMRSETPVYLNKFIDYVHRGGNSSFEMEYFMSDTPYYLDGLALSLSYEMGYEYSDIWNMDEVYYAYIDCGWDGTKELALWFKDVSMSASPTQVYVIIKDIDGKLQVCYATQFGYRSDASINEYGVIHSGGSAGAAVHVYNLDMIDANGDLQCVYAEEDTHYAEGLYLPWLPDSMNLIEQMDVAECMYFESYSFEQYHIQDSYEDYLKNKYYVYYDLDEDFNITSPDEIYSEEHKYAQFMKKVGLEWKTPDEMAQILDEHVKSMIPKDEYLVDEEPEWTLFWNAGVTKGEDDYKINDTGCAEYLITNPGWEYYSTVEYDGKNTSPKLTLISQEANEIIDTQEWMDDIGEDEADYTGKKRSDNAYQYELLGPTSNPTIIAIYDGPEAIARLDMSEFVNPPEVEEGWEWLVEEEIRGIFYYGDLLYVSMAHRTYAETAPQNAYVMALDPSNDYQVVWKSAPLVSNANNFVVINDTVICGYGFTNEPDYIYLLDRYSGVQTDFYSVKTGPDYFFIRDNYLHVRTYNTNYVFGIEY